MLEGKKKPRVTARDNKLEKKLEKCKCQTVKITPFTTERLKGQRVPLAAPIVDDGEAISLFFWGRGRNSEEFLAFFREPRPANKRRMK